MQRTWACVLAAAVLYVPANALPVMVTTSALQREEHTLLGGIHELWLDGSWGLAIIVFIASIAVPVLKIGVLGLLAWTVRRAPDWRRLERARLYRLIETVGHWSMLDVYVVVLLAATVRFGPLASVSAGLGLLSFAAVVVLTLLATWSFDPKMIWQEPASRWLKRRIDPRTAAGAAARTGDATEALPQPQIAQRAALEHLAGLAGAAGRDRDRGLDARAQRLPHRSADRDRVQVGRRHRGRQDRGPLQGSGDRQGRTRSDCATTASASSSVVQLDRSAASFAVEDTSFWVVRPRIGAAGISGLGTLLSGAYIGTDAGVSKQSRSEFIGLEAPPFVLRGEPGTRLRAARRRPRLARRRLAGVPSAHAGRPRRRLHARHRSRRARR